MRFHIEEIYETRQRLFSQIFICNDHSCKILYMWNITNKTRRQAFLQTPLLTYNIVQNKQIPIRFSYAYFVYDWISALWHI